MPAPYDQRVLSASRRGPARARLLGGAVGLALVSGLVVAGVADDEPGPVVALPTEVPAHARVAAPPLLAAPTTPDQREAAVRALLEARADALQRRDRTAFLATVDPQARAFRDRQRRWFDNLARVPTDGWRYELVGEQPRAGADALDRRHGETGWWAPRVILRYALGDYDPVPTAQVQHLTFVLRAGKWYVGSDDDFRGEGADTARALWDYGPVTAVATPTSLVLGSPDQRPLLRQLADAAAAAVPRVSAVWGNDWAERVVLVVPRNRAELGRISGVGGDLSQIAALATAQSADGGKVGDRIVVNASAFGRLGPVGRRVVLTHEVTHVATRAVTGDAMPTWLAEGFADHVGYSGTRVPLRDAAGALQRQVRSGRLPAGLPADSAFGAEQRDLAAAYEQSWLAVRLLAERYGEPALLRFYRAVGTSELAPDEAVEEALRRELGTSTPAFVREWRADLQKRLR